MKTEIIGTGYAKDVEVGESYLRENVINMWDFAPKGAFVFYSDGIQMTLQELTKISENGYTARTLTKEEITPEIRQALIDKGLTVPSSPLQ